MKTLFITAIILLSFVSTYAQVNHLPLTGNVGIGTNDPKVSLDVNGITRSNGPVTFLGPGTSSETSGTNKRGLYLDNGLSTGWRLMTLVNANGTLFSIEGNGNVAIGTPNPAGYKLAVEGTIGARKVKVTQETWADFVFHPDYKLPSLQEVSLFVQQHKHLPGIPSEKEVKEKGLDLGEMNKLLLQKVEEQLLYIIELSQTVNELSRKTQQLEQKLSDLNGLKAK